ncbi:hypothetical protein B0O99DRAFT_638511 [Bisporella sp. PMI_857]|nr:hypothetical protein B0O99DRAFT_638511 [Bisporella sp. PMI_857]
MSRPLCVITREGLAVQTCGILSLLIHLCQSLSFIVSRTSLNSLFGLPSLILVDFDPKREMCENYEEARFSKLTKQGNDVDPK